MMTASSKARSIPGRPTLGFVSDFIANILAGDDTLWKERCEGPNASTACRVDPRTLLSPPWGSPDSVAVSPKWGPIATSEEEGLNEARSSHRHRAWFAGGYRARWRSPLEGLSRIPTKKP